MEYKITKEVKKINKNGVEKEVTTTSVEKRKKVPENEAVAAPKSGVASKLSSSGKSVKDFFTRMKDNVKGLVNRSSKKPEEKSAEKSKESSMKKIGRKISSSFTKIKDTSKKLSKDAINKIRGNKEPGTVEAEEANVKNDIKTLDMDLGKLKKDVGQVIKAKNIKSSENIQSSQNVQAKSTIETVPRIVA